MVEEAVGLPHINCMVARAPIRLSKSKFVTGVQCLKRLYLQVYDTELAEQSTRVSNLG
jgi:hypothetical protein